MLSFYNINIKNMSKKVLYSLIVISIAIIAAITGTVAFFSATQTVDEASFIAGTLDLDVRSGNVPLESFILENLGEDITMSGYKDWTIKNTGSLPGRLLIRLENVENVNGGCNDQKKMVRPNCENEDFGMLGQYLTFTLRLDGEDLVSSSLSTEEANNIGSQWSQLEPIVLESGEERTIRAYWMADPDQYGNEIQADSVKFDISFRLIQKLEDSNLID
jgi:hypothetical protein